MNNYEYIVASLPVLRLDDLKAGKGLAEKLLGEIRSQLSGRDNALLDFLLLGHDPDQLNADFYKRALAHKNRFLKEWFAFDLDLRNATVAYLNDSLGREKGRDQILLEGREEEEFPERAKADAILHGTDILDRERGLDELRWQKIDEITLMDYFDIEVRCSANWSRTSVPHTTTKNRISRYEYNRKGNGHCLEPRDRGR